MKALGGAPLIAWTIRAAQQSRCFDRVLVCSDDAETLAAATYYGAEPRGRTSSADDEADIVWIPACLDHPLDAFAILRPTSPFRTAQTIQTAVKCFQAWPCDSVRSVRYARENPFKMWQTGGEHQPIQTLIEALDEDGTPYHSLPSQQTMGTLYVQTGGLEIAHSRVLRGRPPTISGEVIYPIHLEGPDSLDLNTLDDWADAERLLASGAVTRPPGLA